MSTVSAYAATSATEPLTKTTITRRDPGPQFPWHRLYEAGVIAWPDAAQVAAKTAAYAAALPGIDWAQTQLGKFGYLIPVTGQLDEHTRNVISAFQMKYRPGKYDGELDAETAALIDVATTPGGMLMVDGKAPR